MNAVPSYTVDRETAATLREWLFENAVEKHGESEITEPLAELAAAIDGVLEDPAPSAPLTTLGDSAIVFNARAWIDPSETGAGGVTHELTENILHRFEEADIGFPYPHTEIVGSLDIDQPAGSAVADD